MGHCTEDSKKQLRPEMRCCRKQDPYLLQNWLWCEHGTVDLQDLLFLNKVLSPCLDDVVLQGTPNRPEVVQTTDTCQEKEVKSCHRCKMVQNCIVWGKCPPFSVFPSAG